MEITLKGLIDTYYTPHWAVYGVGNHVTCQLCPFMDNLFTEEPMIIVSRGLDVNISVPYHRVYRTIGSKITRYFNADAACRTEFHGIVGKFYGMSNNEEIRSLMERELLPWWRDHMPDCIRNLSIDEIAAAIWYDMLMTKS